MLGIVLIFMHDTPLVRPNTTLTLAERNFAFVGNGECKQIARQIGLNEVIS